MLLGLLQELDFCQALKLNPAIRQERLYFIKSRKIGGQPMTTFTREQWERKESADWWNAGQAARQQIIGAATEKMLDLAGVQAGSRVLDVAAGTGESTLMAAQRVGGRGYVLATDQSSSMLSVAAEAVQGIVKKHISTPRTLEGSTLLSQNHQPQKLLVYMGDNIVAAISYECALSTQNPRLVHPSP